VGLTSGLPLVFSLSTLIHTETGSTKRGLLPILALRQAGKQDLSVGSQKKDCASSSSSRERLLRAADRGTDPTRPGDRLMPGPLDEIRSSSITDFELTITNSPSMAPLAITKTTDRRFSWTRKAEIDSRGFRAFESRIVNRNSVRFHPTHQPLLHMMADEH